MAASRAKRKLRPSLYTIWLFLSLLFLVEGVSGWSRLGATSDISKRVHTSIAAGSLTERLLSRTGPNLANFERAKDIIRQMENSPICAHVPTRRLLNQCKALKASTEIIESARALDNAKTVYAIRQAICETQQANVEMPFSCAVFEPHKDNGDTQVETFSEKDIRSCLSAFKPDHAFWTSYSKFKQDSSTLCDPARLDYQLEELLSVYRDLTNLLPNVVEAMQQQAEMSRGYMLDVHKAAKSSLETIHRSREDIKHVLHDHAMHVSYIRQNVSELLGELQNFRDLVRDEAFNNIQQANEAMAIFERRSQLAQTNFASIFASVAELVSGLGLRIEDLQDHLEPAQGILANLNELTTNDRLENLARVTTETLLAGHELLTLQNKQFETATNQHQLMQVTLDKHLASNSLLTNMVNTLNDLKVDIDGFAHVVNSFAIICRSINLKTIFVLISAAIVTIMIILARYPALHTAICLFVTIVGAEIIWWTSSWRMQLRSFITAVTINLWLFSFLTTTSILVGLCFLFHFLPKRRSTLRKLSSVRQVPRTKAGDIYNTEYRNSKRDRHSRAATSPPEFRV